MPTKPKCSKLSPISEDDFSLLFPFTEEEYIGTLKNMKAAGIDDVLVEQLKNLIAKRMVHREPNSQSMEDIENHCNTETVQRLIDTEELQTYIPHMSHI